MFFTIIKIETNPEVIVCVHTGDRISYEAAIQPGEFCRVMPSSAHQVFALNMLEHHREKFAPAHGNGILVTRAGLDKYI